MSRPVRDLLVIGALSFVLGIAVALGAGLASGWPAAAHHEPSLGDSSADEPSTSELLVLQQEIAALRVQLAEARDSAAPRSAASGADLVAENRRLLAALAEHERSATQRDRALERVADHVQWLRDLVPDRFGDLTAGELLELRDLDLTRQNLQDDDLARLAGLSALRSVDLTKTAITDGGLAHLAGIGSLMRVGLRETGVTDAGLGQLTKIRGLRHLDLNLLPITDDGIRVVGQLTGLKFLRLNFTKITDVGLAHLRSLTELERLDLWGTKIGANPPHLIGMGSLRHLDVGATQVSAQWVQQFRAANPECHVVSRYTR